MRFEVFPYNCLNSLICSVFVNTSKACLKKSYENELCMKLDHKVTILKLNSPVVMHKTTQNACKSYPNILLL